MATESRTGLVTPIDRRTRAAATANYIDCLALPQNSQVLVVTDMPPESRGFSYRDSNLQLRRDMATAIAGNVNKVSQMLELHPAMSHPAMSVQTEWALRKLDQGGRQLYMDEDVTTTVVYLGDAWNNRAGIYSAVNDFASTRTPGSVRIAGSLGFTTGDCRVMSELGKEERARVAEAGKYITEFMKNYPSGSLTITTQGAHSASEELSLPYNNVNAPFATEIGRFDPDNPVFKGNYVYMNIPGGEAYGTPYPFQETNGRFVANGILFTVENGKVVDVKDAEKGAMGEMKEPSQRLLLGNVRNGRKIPVSELGIGFYALAGVKTYPDSSVLSSEKGGPHIGMGHVANKSTEQDEIAEAAGDFHHTDFVMDNPTIYYSDATGTMTQMYPPLKAN